MQQRLTSTLLAAMLTVTAGAAVAAESAKGDAGATFVKLDADKDGFVSKAEADRMPELAAVFDKADGNADGKLDPQEFAATMSSGSKK